MKQILFVTIVGLMAACSSSRHAANFHYYKSNSEPAGGYGELKPRETITPIQPEKLVASTNNETTRVAETTPLTTVIASEQIRKTYLQMNKVERKNLRNALKVGLKKQLQLTKNSDAAAPRGWWQGWDQDLKLAAIFGAIGTTAMIIYTEPFFIIGAVALIIGLVFFIKWFVRQ